MRAKYHAVGVTADLDRDPIHPACEGEGYLKCCFVWPPPGSETRDGATAGARGEHMIEKSRAVRRGQVKALHSCQGGASLRMRLAFHK